ncbi:sensor histidine kinase [Jannaschia sp. M317]|uniref:sensor histidine kinase n=1 Tax=Jannaschia sp. M317 TaxID=2867011 RepID=UPI0021A896D0|nr:sensor histidine kinase [Jannaschia sp. M317]UWQ18059.1 sensor histidine kinase [Jannaschia sp. M317]
MFQTGELAEEVSNRTSLTLLNQTKTAAFGKRQVLERSLGAADALSGVLHLLRKDSDECRAYLEEYLETAEHVTFVGFLPVDGVMECSSAGETVDFSEDPSTLERIADPRLGVDVLQTPRVSREPVIVVTLPTFDEAEVMQGYVVLSISLAQAQQSSVPVAEGEDGPSSLIIFNEEGDVLLQENLLNADEPLWPDNRALINLADDRERTFNAEDQFGEMQTFAVVPIIPEVVYAIAAWPERLRGGSLAGVLIPPLLPPLLMFLASIGVAYFAVDRLVVRHVSDLRHKMRNFASRRFLPQPSRRGALSSELLELEQSFSDMALDLSNDEARMEDALREKNVLLKEIHHRVKNNLQLISSIMNMQIRAAEQPETVSVLRRLQDRVLGLATVHRNLYQAENLSRSNAGRLLSELFHQLIKTGRDGGQEVTFTSDFDEVILFPDQAVPLSLLASELGTNALKNVGAPQGETPYIHASFRMEEPGVARFVCENSVNPQAPAADETTRTGLGSQLIRAFAAQLGSQMEIDTSETHHRTEVVFRVDEFSQEPEDY